MEIKREKNPITGDTKFTLILTESDYLKTNFDGHDRYLIEYFGREGATIEERLMGLQIIAKAVEESEENERLRTQQS